MFSRGDSLNKNRLNSVQFTHTPLITRAHSTLCEKRIDGKSHTCFAARAVSIKGQQKKMCTHTCYFYTRKGTQIPEGLSFSTCTAPPQPQSLQVTTRDGNLWDRVPHPLLPVPRYQSRAGTVVPSSTAPPLAA